ncbi:unnamed protein product [Calicophoron daubneyi]|uniref:Uncharacterized protein n=1 Tax=Calicophoron daubneyi TaxID=300641 RepID=A0AAV2TBB2_CALDB
MLYLVLQSDQLKSISGRDLRTLFRNLLSRLISPSVSEEIHCTGKGRLFVFENSRLHGFLLNQVCQRPGFATVSAKAVNTGARLWFKLLREQFRNKNPQAINLIPENVGDITDEGEEESSEEDREQGERYNRPMITVLFSENPMKT